MDVDNITCLLSFGDKRRYITWSLEEKNKKHEYLKKSKFVFAKIDNS